MVTLAVDTSHPVGSVSLGRSGAVFGTMTFGGASSHLVEIGRCVDRLLAETGLHVGGVERIALVIGPGSFTGLRVGLAYVKGLRAGLDADVVTIGTLELLALPLLRDDRPVCPMVDARKKEVYAAVYRAPSSHEGLLHAADVLVAPRVQAPGVFLAEAGRFAPVFVGSGAVAYQDVIEKKLGRKIDLAQDGSQPSTAYLCRIAHLLEPLKEDEVRELVPVYIRASAAELKRLKPIDPHA